MTCQDRAHTRYRGLMSREITPRLSYLIGRLDRIVGRQLETVLAEADPVRARAVRRSLLRLELLRRYGTLLVMPDEILIR